MIDMEQEVEMQWNNNIKKYYTGLGYNFTKKYDKFFPKLKHIPKSSSKQVEVVCDYCGQKYKMKYCDYTRHLRNDVVKKDCCSNCRRQKIIDTRDLNKPLRAEKQFTKLKRIMDEKGYKLITKQEEYTGISMPIQYICPFHGLVHQRLQDIIYENAGCRKCSDIKHGKNLKNSVDKVIKIINSIDNNKLLNPEEYISVKTRNLWVQCSCGNKFLTSLTAYVNGKNRCSKCCESESAGEKKIRQWLDSNNIEYIQEYCFKNCKDQKPLPFDFNILNSKICIEYDGKQHFYPYFGDEAFKKTVLHDNIKNEYCKNNSIKLIRIPYTQYRNIDKILTKELLTT